MLNRSRARGAVLPCLPLLAALLLAGLTGAERAPYGEKLRPWRGGEPEPQGANSLPAEQPKLRQGAGFGPCGGLPPSVPCRNKKVEPDPGKAPTASTKKALKPKVDRATLFRARSKSTTVPPPTEDDRDPPTTPSAVAVVAEEDPCKRSTPLAGFLCPSTTERPTPAPRRGLPVTAARLHHQSRLTLVPTPKPGPTILYSDFYRTAEEEAAAATVPTMTVDVDAIRPISTTTTTKAPCTDGTCFSSAPRKRTRERVEATTPRIVTVNPTESPEEPQPPPTTTRLPPRASRARGFTRVQPAREQDAILSHSSGPFRNEEHSPVLDQRKPIRQEALTTQRPRETRTRGENIPRFKYPPVPAASRVSGGEDEAVAQGHVPSPDFCGGSSAQHHLCETTVKRIHRQGGEGSDRLVTGIQGSWLPVLPGIRTPLLEADSSERDESVLGYDYTPPVRPFPTPALVPRPEQTQVRGFDVYGLGDDGTPTPVARPQRPRPAVIPQVEELQEDVYPRNSLDGLALQSSRDEVQAASSPSLGKVFHGGRLRSQTQQLDAQTSPSLRVDSVAAYKDTTNPYIFTAGPAVRLGGQVREPPPDQKPSSNEQSLDFRLTRPDHSAPPTRAHNGYALLNPVGGYEAPVPMAAPVAFNPFQAQTQSGIFVPQQTPASAENLLAVMQRQREEQQANFAAHAIIGALQLQAEMLQKHQPQQLAIHNRPSINPQQSLSALMEANAFNQQSTYGLTPAYQDDIKQQQNSAPTTERPRTKSRKKKNKKKHHQGETSQKGDLISDGHIISVPDGDIVFERPMREPEIVFDRPGSRKPYSTQPHPEMLHGPPHVEGSRRPAFGPQTLRFGGPPRPKHHMLTRPPIEVISLHRQKRQDGGYIYPRPTGPAFTDMKLEQESLPGPSSPENAEAEGTVPSNGGQGYNYQKPDIPFPPEPDTIKPAPEPLPSAGPVPETADGPPEPPGTPPGPTASPFPTAPVPVRPKPTPAPDLIPESPVPATSPAEGYDYPKPAVTLPTPSSRPRPTPEGSVELPGPTENPSPSGEPTTNPQQQTVKPELGQSTEGYNYPVPLKPFST